ncbi:hypothetical protein [uncultured Clostridium sp.]|uniref:hypothetical protein n=1 Tax=uncultured Clostridium sp. TaxID=59620 RepID=UPI0026153AC0|nr:hypothetical protein [uncultured Clostridium sp.]
MTAYKEIIKELALTEEQLNDKEIQKFVKDVAFRKQTGNWYQYWNGNGFIEINKKDGTSIRTVLDDKPYVAEFPENCDMNISLKCTNGCQFCYEGCTPDGKHADLKKYLYDKNSFLYTLHEGTELALNGNQPLHPDLDLLLGFCKERGILANLTVNETTLMEYKLYLEHALQEGLIHGIGVSPVTYSKEMIEFCMKHPTAVIHTIVGITTPEQYKSLQDKGLKILILGYKIFGRGESYLHTCKLFINLNAQWLGENVKNFPKHFKVVSFDNLAIEQLNPKEWLGDEGWNKFYRGDDGSHTMYIDLVNETFAKNSIQARTNHKPIMNDIRDMLKEVQKEKQNG